MSKPLIIIGADVATSLAAGCQSQCTFNSPGDAVSALADAVKWEDKSELQRIFGPEIEQIKTGNPDRDHDDLIVFASWLEIAHVQLALARC